MPRYIAETNNGDIVVTDFDIGPGAVVVTDKNGIHRFSFTGHPSGSELHPRGICGSDKNNTVCIYQCIHLKDA